MATCSYCQGTGWVGDGTSFMPRERCHLWPRCTPPAFRLVRIAQTYPHHASLRGAVGRLARDYGDGTVAIRFYEGEHVGDTVCLAREYVEVMS